MSSQSVTYQGSGLVFNNTYGSGVSATFQNEIVAAENYLQSVFTNACTVNCNFDLQSINPAYSGENFFSPITVSYSTFVNALVQHATTAAAIAAANSLSNLQDPTHGAGVEVSIGEARILGLAGAGGGTDDSVILNSYYWTASALQSDPGDAEAVVEHEITEGIMGRIGSLGVADSAWAPMDFFRFTASGQRDFTGGKDGQATYFSVDGSTVYTGLQFHNSVNSSGQFDGFDLADWDQVGADANAHDPFGPGGPGAGDPGTLSATDITVLNVLGWNVASANSPPVVTASNRTATHLQTFAVSNLFTASDPDGDAITVYNLRDSGTGGAHFVVNGVSQGAQQTVTLTPAQLAQTTYQSGSGVDTIQVQAFDGTQWGAWTSFTVTAPSNLSPVVTVTNANVSAAHGQSIAASSLFTASDPDGDSIMQYLLYQQSSGPSNGYFVVNGVVESSYQLIYLTPAQLAQTTFHAGNSVSDDLFIKAYDGISWSSWGETHVTAAADLPPVVTVTSANVSAAHGQSIVASSLFTASDADGDPITQYLLYQQSSGPSNGYFVVNSVVESSYQLIYLTPAQLAQTTFHAGNGASDDLFIKAYDGTSWSSWGETHVTDPPPVVTVTSANLSAAHDQSIAASSLFTASDPDGDPITQYLLYQQSSGSGNGYFVVNGVAESSYQLIYLTPAQLAQTTFHAGDGASDDLFIKAYDGTSWSSWGETHVTAAADLPPVVTVTSANVSAAHDQSIAVSSLFTASDPDGDPITQYLLYQQSSGSGNGHFVVNGVAESSYQLIYLTPAQLAQTTFQGGSGATDDLFIKAYDGNQWSAWGETRITAAADQPLVVPVVATGDLSMLSGQPAAVSSMFSASDADGDTINQYLLYQQSSGPGNGHFTVNGVAQGSYQLIYLTLTQLAQTAFQAGTSATDDLFIKAYDGFNWSSWGEFHITPTGSGNSVAVAPGGTLDIGSAYSGTVAFSGTTGTLELDSSSTFTGKIGGQLAIGDVIDLADITAGAAATVGYTGNNSPGTLTVGDSAHTASIALLANYMASSFVATSDGHGGTSIVDPPGASSTFLAPPHG